MCVCVGVCVCESHSVPKSNFLSVMLLDMYQDFSRGQWPIHESIANEATHELGGYHD